MNYQQIFREVLALVGHTVEVASHSDPKPLHGKITNAMFDSFILDVQGKPQIIRFEDIVYVNPRG